jgi:hypothetical protein
MWDISSPDAVVVSIAASQSDLKPTFRWRSADLVEGEGISAFIGRVVDPNRPPRLRLKSCQLFFFAIDRL